MLSVAQKVTVRRGIQAPSDSEFKHYSARAVPLLNVRKL